MFKAIKYLSGSRFRVLDTTFTDEVIIQYFDNGYYVATICKVYKKRNLPVVPNIVQFYINLPRISNSLLILHKQTADKYFPEVNYGSLYFPCVYRKLKHACPNSFL